MINYSNIVLREATFKANNYTGKPDNYMCFNNAGGVEIARLDFNGSELIFTGDADEAAKILIDYIGNYWATYHRQLKELQEAVMALEPFDDEFQQMVEMHHGYYAPENCTHCELKYPNHKPDCPVTKLREVLKKQGLE